MTDIMLNFFLTFFSCNFLFIFHPPASPKTEFCISKCSAEDSFLPFFETKEGPS